MNKHIQVAAAVIVNAEQQIFIAQRAADAHQGGLWEFPGGKLEPGEDSYQALCRELDEELGIQVSRARPLIRIHHDYPDRSVTLHVWRVSAFDGVPHGREGQPVAWVSQQELGEWAFPAANLPIIQAARLSNRYLITPEPDQRFLEHLETALRGGIRFLQLRAHSLSDDDYKALAVDVIALSHEHGAQVLLNRDPEMVLALGADGVQLNRHRLQALSERPLPYSCWVGASCHNLAELQQALQLNCDFAVLSPVQKTASHPEQQGMGWDSFADQVNQVAMPVYALGGLSDVDMAIAHEHGAQGIAAIRALWEGS